MESLQPQPVRLVYFGPGVEVMEVTARGQPTDTSVLPADFQPVIAALYGAGDGGLGFAMMHDASECGRPANTRILRCRMEGGGWSVSAQALRDGHPGELMVTDWKAVQPPPDVMRSIIQAQVNFARGNAGWNYR